MVRGNVRMRAAQDLVLYKPVCVERTQNPQRLHGIPGEKHVVYHTLEVKPAKEWVNMNKNQ